MKRKLLLRLVAFSSTCTLCIGCAFAGVDETSTTGEVDESLGTAHPIKVLDAHPQGLWVAACQARLGEPGDETAAFGLDGEAIRAGAFRPFLMFDDGELSIDDFIAADPEHRYVAFVREGKLVIFDTLERADVVSDVVPSRYPYSVDAVEMLRRRAADFDDTGRHFVYVASRPGDVRLVVLDLWTGEETWLELGTQRFWDVTLLGNGSWLSARLTPLTSLDRSAHLTRSSPRCFARYSPPFFTHPDATLVSTQLGHQHIGQFLKVGSMTTELLAHRDGSLWWPRLDGTEARVAGQDCRPLVHALWKSDRAVVFQCTDGEDGPMQIHRSNETVALSEASSTELNLLPPPDYQRTACRKRPSFGHSAIATDRAGRRLEFSREGWTNGYDTIWPTGPLVWRTGNATDADSADDAALAAARTDRAAGGEGLSFLGRLRSSVGATDLTSCASDAGCPLDDYCACDVCVPIDPALP